MKTWIALFRGINVGGKNVLPMAKLREDLQELKLKNVRTYIQSGNVVFDSAAKTTLPLAKKIATRIEERYGFRPPVFILDRDALQAAVDSNPFPQAVTDPKTLHLFFLAQPATNANLTALDEAKAPTERYELTDQVFYLHAPDGIGRSKLAANAEKHLGIVATARNFRTVDQLLSLAASIH